MFREATLFENDIGNFNLFDHLITIVTIFGMTSSGHCRIGPTYNKEMDIILPVNEIGLVAEKIMDVEHRIIDNLLS